MEKNLENKKAPHLTNLNEDTQLTGKLYYSLANLANQHVYIGRKTAVPTPQIILLGAGIQEKHAHFEVNK